MLALQELGSILVPRTLLPAPFFGHYNVTDNPVHSTGRGKVTEGTVCEFTPMYCSLPDPGNMKANEKL